MRIGHGYDAHRLAEGETCVLGGVEIPCSFGPVGHSDADVPVHALMDALLGAAAMGDIGKMFPDSDPALKGADSVALLRQVVAALREKGYVPVNADVTVIAQRPKLAPYIGAMRERLAEACGLTAEEISVKATTEEGMGFTGTGEGIAAHAVVLIERIDSSLQR